MKVFVIHRFNERNKAKKKLKKIAKELSIEIQPIFLNSSDDDKWKDKAKKMIAQVEAVIVYNPDSCKESANTKWEIETTKDAEIEIIEINKHGCNSSGESRLKSLYELEEEFNNCFSSNNEDAFKLYKLMIESSEGLIQRRQKTNAFFITVIGSLLAIASLLIKTGVIDKDSIGILLGFSTIGLLLCNSWRNLIDNYGKLNKAKFDVILRLEKDLTSKIYSAEWISLGKGLRPKRYKSFTSTEKNVPLFFGLLIIILTAVALYSGWDIATSPSCI